MSNRDKIQNRFLDSEYGYHVKKKIVEEAGSRVMIRRLEDFLFYLIRDNKRHLLTWSLITHFSLANESLMLDQVIT